MELILKKDVENLGFTDDIVEVKNGYGRNFLIPQKFAVLATASAKKVLAENLKQRAYKEQKLVDEANAQAAKVAELKIKISSKSGTGGKLFGSISNIDFVEALSKEGISIEKKFVSIPGGTIKRLGTYDANVRFHRNVISTVSFEVIEKKA